MEGSCFQNIGHKRHLQNLKLGLAWFSMSQTDNGGQTRKGNESLRYNRKDDKHRGPWALSPSSGS